MRHLTRDRSGLAGVLIAIVIIVIILVAAIALFLVPFKSVKVNESHQVDIAPGARSLSMNVTIDTGSIDVRFVNDSSVAASMTVVGTHRSGLLGPDQPVKVNWTAVNGSESMAIDLNVSVGRNIGWFSNNDIRCTLNISSQLKTALNVTSSLGTVNVTTAEGVTLAGVDLRASAGAVRLNMTGGTVLDGPLRMDTSLGGVDLSWTDLNATGNASVDLRASAGGIRLTMLQGSELDSNLTVRSSASLGGIDITLDLRGNTSAHVISHADLGGVRVSSRDGFNGSDGDMASQNYPGRSNLEVRSNASAGGINIRSNYTA
ncbi:MAG: hypothetical protein SA339_06785 [Methanomassiliicoccus sp.]|nr:hypothetical protein [Methanomassiliicoccus sp.]